MLCLKKVGKTHDIIQWGTNLITHVGQERLLEQLGFLSLLGLNSQAALCLHHIGHVTTDTEVVLHLTILVKNGHHIELQPNLPAFLVANLCLDDFLNVVSGQMVHAIQRTGNGTTEARGA